MSIVLVGMHTYVPSKFSTCSLIMSDEISVNDTTNHLAVAPQLLVDSKWLQLLF